MNTGSPAIERIGAPGHNAAEHVWRAPAHHPAVLLLWPLSVLFGLTVRARRLAYRRGWFHSERAPLPVISVGNLTVGGSGKTPFTRWLAEQLIQKGEQPAILHGGSAQDEPALHSRWQPGVLVLAERDRARAARSAAERGATVALLDDGLQHLRLARDLDIVLIAADRWNEPQRMLPSGAWREPLQVLRSADAIVVTRKAASAADAARVLATARNDLAAQSARGHWPVLAVAALQMTDFVTLTGTPAPRPGDAVLLCAIADPQSFLQQLDEMGVRVTATLAYADHHVYTSEELQQARARAGSLPVVVTEKDAVKIARIDAGFPAVVARQRVRIEQGEAELNSLLECVLRENR